MAGENLVSIDFTQDEVAAYQAAIKILETGLIPKLVKISTADRHELPKMGDKTISFVMKSLQYAGKHADLVPSYINQAEWQKDFAAVQELRSLLVPLQKLTDMMQDTAILAGSEAYSASLSFYHAVKNATKMNIPGAAEAYQDMKSRFPGAGHAPANGQEKKTE